MEDTRSTTSFEVRDRPPYEPPHDESSTAKWFLPLVAIVALVVGGLFVFDVIDADVDVDPGSVDVEAPDIDADVDVDVPGVDVESPDVDVDPGSVDVEDPDANADANANTDTTSAGG